MTLDITNREPIGLEVIRTETTNDGIEYCVQLSRYDMVISDHLSFPLTSALPVSLKQRNKKQVEEMLKMTREEFCTWCDNQLYH